MDPKSNDGGVTFNLLVVDDSPMNRKMLCKLLENRGHRCDQAKQGQEPVEKIMHMIAPLTKQRGGNDDNIGYAGAGGSGHGSGNASCSGGARNGELKYYDAILMDFVMPELVSKHSSSRSTASREMRCSLISTTLSYAGPIECLRSP
jgi:CheY-like chemotaxis protein